MHTQHLWVRNDLDVYVDWDWGLPIRPFSDHGSSQSFVGASRPEDAQEIAALRSEVVVLRQQLEVK